MLPRKKDALKCLCICFPLLVCSSRKGELVAIKKNKKKNKNSHQLLCIMEKFGGTASQQWSPAVIFILSSSCVITHRALCIMCALVTMLNGTLAENNHNEHIYGADDLKLIKMICLQVNRSCSGNATVQQDR